MSPGTEMTFAVLGGGAALSGILVAFTRLFSWAITRIIRDEVAPVVEKFGEATSELSTQMVHLRTSYEASQRTQERGNEEMHDAVQAIRARLDDQGNQIAEVAARVEVLDERTATLRQELGR